VTGWQGGEGEPDPEVVARLNVPRETIAQLRHYVSLLYKWQSHINLVSSASLPDVWRRHILDSAQLAPLTPKAPVHLMDIGSGAGFPGLVLAIVTDHHVTLVESDQRKAVFLKTVIRELGLSAEVKNNRIEVLPALGAKIVTARALAPVPKLLDLLANQMDSVQKCLFLKGVSVQGELTDLESYPNISHRILPSVSSADGVVLELDVTNFARTEL